MLLRSGIWSTDSSFCSPSWRSSLSNNHKSHRLAAGWVHSDQSRCSERSESCVSLASCVDSTQCRLSSASSLDPSAHSCTLACSWSYSCSSTRWSASRSTKASSTSDRTKISRLGTLRISQSHLWPSSRCSRWRTGRQWCLTLCGLPRVRCL